MNPIIPLVIVKVSTSMETDQWRSPGDFDKDQIFSIPLLYDDTLNYSYFPLFKGLPSNSIIEIVGLPGSGKTCLALHATLNALKLRSDSSVIYIDTSNNFTERRFNQIFRSSKDKTDSPVTDYLDRINILPVVDIFDLFAQLYRIDEIIADMKFNARFPSLLIIDNIAAPFKLTPKFSLEHRLQLIEKFIRDLRSVCSKYNLTIIAINQLTKKMIPGGLEAEPVFQFIPFLGKAWRHSIDFSIKLDGDNNRGRFMELTKSIYNFEPLVGQDEIIQSKNKIRYKFTDGGILLE